MHILAADPFLRNFAKLNESFVQIIEDYPFVGYHTLNIQDKESVVRLLKAIDKSNGYMYGNLDATKLAYQHVIGHPEKDHRYLFEVQERYLKKGRSK